MVDQVLLNLAVNARDAMPQGGRLIIETSAVEFDSTRAAQFPPARPGRFACLSVSDNGKGIRPEILPHIFEPFFTTKAVGKGTGLGLATVFGIVQQHEGWINVASELGAGTTFRIYLPLLTQSSADPVAATPPSAPQPGHETILLAEDETALRELVHTILSRLGYRVLEAPSGVAALKLWEDHRHEIQLLLTDIVMPDGVNGLELAQRLLTENPKLKVIFMSGYSQDIAGQAMALVEGENFLAKPFQAAQLVRLIRAQLEAPTIPISAPKLS
jgi:CheY-like chemotaxis protein